MTVNRPDHHSHRRPSKRALWPDTMMARAFLIALTKWAITHHDNIDAKITLPVGIVGAGEVLKVLRALEKARISPSRAEGAHP